MFDESCLSACGPAMVQLLRYLKSLPREDMRGIRLLLYLTCSDTEKQNNYRTPYFASEFHFSTCLGVVVGMFCISYICVLCLVCSACVYLSSDCRLYIERTRKGFWAEKRPYLPYSLWAFIMHSVCECVRLCVCLSVGVSTRTCGPHVHCVCACVCVCVCACVCAFRSVFW